MIILDTVEIGILQKLIFEESYENILLDCKSLALPNIITDVLKTLIHRKLVVAKYPVDWVQPKKSKAGFMYDSDRMKDYSYQATAKGLKYI